LLRRRDSASAAAHFERALTLDGADADVHNDAVVAYGMHGQHDRALHHLRAALRLDPAHRAAAANLATLTAGGKPAQTSR
jgi:Flp pilus assembly protein TadD